MTERERVFRSRYLTIRFEESSQLDAAALLRGELSAKVVTGQKIVSAVGDTAIGIDDADLDLIRRIPSKGWTEVAELESEGAALETLEKLIRAGVLISDSPRHATLREREEAMRAMGWAESAAFFHRVSQWQHRSERTTDDGDGSGDRSPFPTIEIENRRERAAEAAERFIAEHGPPPEIVPGSDRLQGPRVTLPTSDRRDNDLFRALEGRRSYRTFARRPLNRHDLATVLRWTFGCHGLFRLHPSYHVQHKTSPSGGALHPVEAYPLVMSVEGVEPGLYHYGSMTHQLTRLRRVEEAETRELATRLSSGQDFFGEAGVAVLLTARFRRSFWKYPEVDRAYSVLLQDVGHLSQTFYLLATHLGLGAIYTGAVVGEEASELLSVDPTEEGPIGLLALGHPREDADTWLPIEDFDPAGD